MSHPFLTPSGGLFRYLIAFAGLATVFWAAPASAQRPVGIDVSYWQGSLTQSNWNSVYSSGRRFAFVRATHWTATGETYAHGDPDPYFVNNMNRATTAGLYTGAYNFARPTRRSPSTDASYFLTYASPYMASGYLRPMLDLEEGGGSTPVGAANLTDWANAWLDYVESQTGVEGLVYCNSNYANNYLNWRLNHRTLVIANYSCSSNPQTANPPAGTGIFPTWFFWQYCSTGSVPGIAGNCDLDVFNGTLSQMQGHVIGAVAQPSISSIQATNIGNTSATITWYTNPTATTRVRYGTTSSYGSQSAYDGTYVNNHSVILSGLQANTTYHYQVVSASRAGSTVSTDQTFTTTGGGGGGTDVVVDNTDAACTVTGTWTVGTSSTHIGSNYIWCNGVTGTSEGSATKKIRWTPNLVSAYYDIYVYYAAGSNRSAYTYWKITNAGTTITLRVNEQNPGNAYTLIASNVPFNAGTGGYVELMNNTGDTAVVQGDAVKFAYKSMR